MKSKCVSEFKAAKLLRNRLMAAEGMRIEQDWQEGIVALFQTPRGRPLTSICGCTMSAMGFTRDSSLLSLTRTPGQSHSHACTPL